MLILLSTTTTGPVLFVLFTYLDSVIADGRYSCIIICNFSLEEFKGRMGIMKTM